MARASPEFDATGVEALTFDCYGTLIDWDLGIRRALAALPSLVGCDIARLLTERELIERELEAGEWLPYGRVLERSLADAAAQQAREPSVAELVAFAASMPGWPPHADAPGALLRLARRYRLAILSNVETAVLEQSVQLLRAPFAVLVTAAEIRSYKPARAHFDEGLRRLALPREAVLHVAASRFHDVTPAKRLGWRVALIERDGERDGKRSAQEPAPDLVVRDLTELAERLGA